jgi:hypothetical protein
MRTFSSTLEREAWIPAFFPFKCWYEQGIEDMLGQEQ